MMSVFVPVTRLIPSASSAGAESTGLVPPIGFIVLGLIGIPVVFLISAAVFSRPRNRRISILFLICVGTVIGATIAGLALIGAVLGFVIPD